MFFKTKVFYSSRLPTRLFQKKNALYLIDTKSNIRLKQKNVFYLAGGEGVKKFSFLENVLKKMLELNIDRKGELVVIGGGSVLDLGGLAASLYLRGIRLTLVPTTLLSMVDATYGGKTAIDTSIHGLLVKNSFGTFYQAHEIWINFNFLKTLPKKERVSGVGELLKTLWIDNQKNAPMKSILAFLNIGSVDRKLAKAICASLKIKERIVAEDLYDKKNKRIILNLGHTVGHILEGLSKRLSHGEAVLWGIAVESLLVPKSIQSKHSFQAIQALGLKAPKELKRSDKEWMRLFYADKKRVKSEVLIPVLKAEKQIIIKKTNIKQLLKTKTLFLKLFCSH
ncbi:MAG: 3-dehydroquinate synthase [Oligoflexia bacterium]|nr:3-dehydroquinate synthase [Oligoflexia bacterium]